MLLFVFCLFNLPQTVRVMWLPRRSGRLASCETLPSATRSREINTNAAGTRQINIWEGSSGLQLFTFFNSLSQPKEKISIYGHISVTLIAPLWIPSASLYELRSLLYVHFPSYFIPEVNPKGISALFYREHRRRSAILHFFRKVFKVQ